MIGGMPLPRRAGVAVSVLLVAAVAGCTGGAPAPGVTAGSAASPGPTLVATAVREGPLPSVSAPREGGRMSVPAVAAGELSRAVLTAGPPGEMSTVVHRDGPGR